MDKTIKTTAYYHLPGLGRYCNALKAEILFLIHEGGRQYKVTNGKLISNVKGIYSYIIDLETKKLSGKKYAIAGPKFFKYKGEWLNDIRHRLGV